MTLKRLVVAGALLFGAAATAGAQAGWAGVYVGVNAGYAFGSSDVTTSTVYSATGYFAQSSVDQINADGMHKFSPSGFIGGATIGWNMSHGHTLFGLEGDFNSMSTSESRSVTTTYPCCAGTSYTLDQSIKTDWMATLRLRLGLQKPTSLWYITGGAAMASVQMDENFTDTFADAMQTGSHSEQRTGWTAGAGFEHALGGKDKWSFKIEYLYADLGTMTYTGGVLNADDETWPDSPFTNTMKLTTSVARVGLNFHFGK